VYTYVTVTGLVDVLVNTSLGLSVPDPIAGVIFGSVVLVQENVVPGVSLVGS